MDVTVGFGTSGGGDNRGPTTAAGIPNGSSKAPPPPPAFMFPVLKFNEIVQCLEELEIDITKQELSEPLRHRDRLRQMWFMVLEVCTGQTEEDLKNKNKNASTTESSSPTATVVALPDSVSDDFKSTHTGFGDVPLFRAVRRLMEIAGYDHFSLRDLYAPEAKRLKQQLSAVINMAKHREEQLRFYTELIEPRAELIAALEEVNDENKLLQSHLKEAKMSSEIKSTELKTIIDECNELELEIGRDNRMQATLREEAAQLKRQANDVKDELTAAEWKLEELEAQEENLRTQIVSSPDRRRQETEDLRVRVQAEKKENASLEDKIQQCKISIRNLKKIQKDLQTTTAMLGELHQSATKYMDIVKSIETIKEQVLEQEKQLAKIEEETNQTQRRIHRSEEEVIAQQKQQGLELEATQDALESFKSQLLAVEKDRRDGMMRVHQGEAEVQTIKEAIEAERLHTKREIASLITEYKKAERRFMERDRNRRQILGILSEPNSNNS